VSIKWYWIAVRLLLFRDLSLLVTLLTDAICSVEAFSMTNFPAKIMQIEAGYFSDYIKLSI